MFDEFDDKPVGAASVGQVHAARLKTGEEVVVKVRSFLLLGLEVPPALVRYKFVGAKSISYYLHYFVDVSCLAAMH